MSAPVLEVFEEIEPASVLGELLKPLVLEQTGGQRPFEGRRIVVWGEDGDRKEFYVRHIKTKGVNEFEKEVMIEDFVLVALLPTSLTTIVIDMRQKVPE